jgi:hypothetical protein
MTDSAAPKPDWIPTTIEDIEARIARGEWPRVRILHDKPHPSGQSGQCVQGRATAVIETMAHVRELSHRVNVLSEADVDGTRDICTYLSKTEPTQLWVWAVPEPGPLAATEGMLEALDDLTEMRAGIADEWTEHVARWSEPMAAKLRVFARIRGGADAHEGWLNDAPKVLIDRVYDELENAEQAMVAAIRAARDGSSFLTDTAAALRREAADVANAIMMVADAVEHQGAGLKRWRLPEVRRRSEPVRIAIGPYLIHEQRGPDGTSGLTIRKNNEVGSDPVFEIEGSGTGHWRHSAYPSKVEDSPEQAYASTGKINGATVAAKPGQRAVTLTAETLALARQTAGLAVADGHSTGGLLLSALTHAEGMPASDLRKLCKWAREVARARIFELNTGSIGDARAAQREPLTEVVEIIDRVLMRLAIDEMPAGSVEVRGSADSEVAAARVIQALGIKLETASLRRLAHGQGSLREDLVVPMLDEVDRLRAELRLAKPVELRTKLVRKLGLPDGTSTTEVADAVDRAIAESSAAKAALIRIDRFVRCLTETEVYTFDDPSAEGIITRIAHRMAKPGDLRIAHQLGVLLDLPSNSPGPAFVAAVERLVERADEQAHTLKLIADEFAGPVGPTNPLPEVRTLKRRAGERDRQWKMLAEDLGNPPNTWLALQGLLRKNRLLDVTLGPLFGISKHGQSLSAEELIEGAKAKLAEVEADGLNRLGDWLRENMGEHFAVEGIADTAIRRLREGDKLLVGVRADLQRREAELEAMEADDWRECKAQALPLTTALKRIDAILRGSDPAEVSEATVIMSAASAEELAVRVAVLQQRVRASRFHGGERTDQLRSVIELGPFEVHRSQQDDLDGETMLAVHETSDNLTERVFAITFTRINGQAKWSKWTIDNSARRLVASLSLALLKIDAISRGFDPNEVEQATINGFVGPDGLVSSKRVQVIVGRIAEQFDGFRQLADRTMTAAAELAACEALIHRGFDRLREVDPEFVESLRKGGS